MGTEPCSTVTTRDLELLEKHFMVLLKSARDEQDLYNKLTQASLDKYEAQVESKFHEVNNLREGLTKDYVRKEAYDALAERLARVAEMTETRIGNVESQQAKDVGSKWAFGVMMILATIAISAVGLFLKHA